MAAGDDGPSSRHPTPYTLHPSSGSGQQAAGDAGSAPGDKEAQAPCTEQPGGGEPPRPGTGGLNAGGEACYWISRVEKAAAVTKEGDVE